MSTGGEKIKILQFYKPHGLKGGVHAEWLYPLLDNNHLPAHIFIERSGQYVPYFFQTIENTIGSNAIIYLEDIDSREAAANLRSTGGFIESIQFDEFFEQEEVDEWTTLIGYQCVQSGLVFGNVKDVLYLETQTLLEISDGNQEHLIPATEDFIRQIDHENKVLSFELPEGMLEI